MKASTIFAIALLIGGIAPLRAADQVPGMPRFDPVPGVVVNHSPQSSGRYIGSPSIVILPGGDYVVSHDLFGPNSAEHQRAVSLVFRSSDRGRTWHKLAEIEGAFWSSLFLHRDALYLLGTDRHHGNLVIRRSTDSGVTWTSPVDAASGLLRNNGEYHSAPMPVIEHHGRLWRAMERRDPPLGWGIHYQAGMLSAPVDADLLAASNWTLSNFLPSERSWNGNDMEGWLEGNAVVSPEGELLDVLRVHTRSFDEKAAIVRIDADGRNARFDPATGFVKFPGGAKKFSIRYDPVSRLYWSLASVIDEPRQKGNPSNIRNTLALLSSADLRDWRIRRTLLHHPDVIRHGFQYADWQFDGEDIVAVSRTAYDDGQGGALNYHDANFLTFHRVKNFRLQDELAAASPAAWVGAKTCAVCHAEEYRAWQASQHAQAMQAATENTVLGNFNGSRYSYAGVTSRFFRRDGKFYVNTDGPDGKLTDFEIVYTFGVAPLQQYLIALPGGRLQAFGIAWDSRPKSRGGGRWFHLYPGLGLKAGNPLHWTGIDQNWNYQCADCHTTHFEKNYDPVKRVFDSRWSEINVSCESCHGPGLRHTTWARGARDTLEHKGLVVALDERRNVHWTPDPPSGNSVRSSPRASSREIETCARCHSRRGQFGDAYSHGPAFADVYRPATLDPGLYWPDGQMRDEVYNHGSFLQSRMQAKGVTCGDCHEPHTQKLRAPGNAVCGQCHLAAKYDAASHHHHRDNAQVSRCADCHMRTTTYMQVDPRHDHSFRIPRPDQSATLGVPNACNQCHAAKTPQWAASAIEQWTGRAPGGFQRFGQALHDAASDKVPTKDVVAGLSAIARDPGHPAIARATALARLADYPTPAALETARLSLDDPDAMVRESALNALAHADAAQRARLLPRLLRDSQRTVRMAATRALAGAPEKRLDPGEREAFLKALAEYVEAQNYNADRPEAHTDLGTLHAERGEAAGAEREFRLAIQLDPGYSPASLNLADLYRGLGREGDVEATLVGALVHAPQAAMLHHALGLAYVRQRRAGEALRELRKATLIDSGNVRYAYVYAIALHDAGKGGEAIARLKQAIRRAPGSVMLRQALESYESERAGVTGK